MGQQSTSDAGGIGTGLVATGVEGSRLWWVRQQHPRELRKEEGVKSKNETDERPPSTSSAVSALNFATLDCLSSSSLPGLRSVARAALSHYGCGSCGPRGFYGTIDAHLEVECAMAEFLGTEGAILYSDGASAATSTVAAFAKLGELLVVDEGVNEALLVGVTLSRANVRYFRHNNMRDLQRVLEKIQLQDTACRRRPTDQLRFLVVEGLYRNWGTMAPFDEIVKSQEISDACIDLQRNIE